MPNPANMPSRRHWVSALPAVVLVAIAVWEIGATRCQATSVPGDAEWHEAAQLVRQGYRPGDLIVFAPGWADPIGRLHLGDLIPLEMAARMDAARYGRIWELSIRGAHAPEVGGAAIVEDHAGAVEVRRYERTPAIVVAELTTAKADPPPRVDLVEVAFEPHRCIVVPVPPNRVGQPERPGTRLVFHDLPLGRELVGYVGIADVFTRREERSPITLDVEIGGAKTTAVAPIDRWVRFSLATPGMRAGDATFTLHWDASPGQPSNAKQVCFTAETRQ